MLVLIRKMRIWLFLLRRGLLKTVWYVIILGMCRRRDSVADWLLQFLDVMVPQSIFEKAGTNKSGAAVLVW